MAFEIILAQDWDKVTAFIDELEQAGFREEIFQSRFLLGTWFETVGTKSDIERIIVQVRDKESGIPVLLMPLVAFKKEGLRTIEFADCNVVDYNGPLVNPTYKIDKTVAHQLIRAIRQALPAHDVLNMEKVRKLSQSAANPLSLLGRARPCAVNGNVVHIGQDWEEYLSSLSRKFRKELRRSERVLQKVGAAEYHQIRTVEKGLRVLDFINDSQRSRIAEVGLDYTLDDPELAAYYRQLIIKGIETGDCIMTTIESGDEIVAATLGIATGTTHGGLRICNAGGKWATCGPGRLIMFNTIKMLHDQGFRSFDFTIGNYALKRRIGVEQLELLNIVYAGSLRGLIAVGEHLGRGFIRQMREKGVLRQKTYKNMGL